MPTLIYVLHYYLPERDAYWHSCRFTNPDEMYRYLEQLRADGDVVEFDVVKSAIH